MNLKLKMQLMKTKHSTTGSEMAAANSSAAPEKNSADNIASKRRKVASPATGSPASSPVATRKSKVDKQVRWEQKNLAVREDIIRGMQEELVELDAFINGKFGPARQAGPEHIQLRRKLVRQLNETKKLFFPKPKVLTDAERAEALLALQTWNDYRETLLKEQPVPINVAALE
jgi:hypothetical protein